MENGKISGYSTVPDSGSKVNRSPNLEKAEESLGGMINNTVEAFYQAYAPYLGDPN